MNVQKIASHLLLSAALMSSTVSRAMGMQPSNPFSALTLTKRDAIIFGCGAAACGLGVSLSFWARSHFGKSNVAKPEVIPVSPVVTIGTNNTGQINQQNLSALTDRRVVTDGHKKSLQVERVGEHVGLLLHDENNEHFAQSMIDQQVLYEEYLKSYLGKRAKDFSSGRVEYQDLDNTYDEKQFISPHINEIVEALRAYREANVGGALDAAGAKNNLFDQGKMHLVQQILPEQFLGDFMKFIDEVTQEPDVHVIRQSLLNERVINNEFSEYLAGQIDNPLDMVEYRFRDVTGTPQKAMIQQYIKAVLMQAFDPQNMKRKVNI